MKKDDSSRVSRGWAHSLWIDTTPDTGFPSLYRDIEVDVAIIGAGIVGVTAANLLKDAGQRVALIEMHKIVHGVTGHTTAKITALHGLVYSELLEAFPRDKAGIYAQANQEAVERIGSIIKRKGIDCNFKRTSAYTYTEQKDNVDTIKQEVEAARKLGLPATFTQEAGLPFGIQGAIRLDNQAQFHPRKYLLALAGEIPGDGSHIFENTRALEVSDGEPCEIKTDKGTLRAKNIILASAYPFHDTGAFYRKLYPHYAYAIGMLVKGTVPEGMYYTEDGNHSSMRNQPADEGLLLIVGGGNHPTGKGGNTFRHYEDIERYATERLEIESMRYYWSTEDYRTTDNVPYIGKTPNSGHIYIATGFSGWGMTQGTLSAVLLTDAILGRANPWAELYDPSRPEPGAQDKRGGPRQNSQSTEERPKEHPANNLDKLANGEGAIFKVDDKELAAYKDEDGKLHRLSNKCTHMGCPVSWNGAERTWDCTCHGSRFNHDGEAIHGPALHNLPEDS